MFESGVFSGLSRDQLVYLIYLCICLFVWTVLHAGSLFGNYVFCNRHFNKWLGCALSPWFRGAM